MIYSLFPHAFGAYQLEYDNEKIMNDLKNYQYIDQNSNIGNLRTTDLDFIENYKDLKFKILEKANEYVLNTTKCNVKMKINSSWATTSDINCFGSLHYHSNSFLTGVYYPHGEGDDISISILNPVVQSFKIGPYKNTTPFTQNTFIFFPKKGSLIFFPSYIFHSINKNTTGAIRCSIACNLIPEQVFGINDRIQV